MGKDNEDQPPAAVPGQEQTDPEKEHLEPTLEDLFKDLPISDDQKKLLANVVGGIATGMAKLNERLSALETQPAADNPDLYAGLSPEQKYEVLMAKASAPAAAAQQGVLQALLARAGGGGGSDLATLAKSAETIQSLRSLIFPEPSAMQLAMEKAQVAQVLAQTRLMNKVAGKATSDYLDKIEAELEPTGEAEK